MEMQQPKNYRLIIQHIIFWLGYMAFQALSYGWEYNDELSFQLPPQIFAVSIPVIIVATYINLHLLMPAYYYQRKYTRYSAALLVLLLGSGLLTRFFTYEFILPWEHMHDPDRFRRENKNFWIPVRILRLSVETIPMIAVTMLMKLMSNAYQQEKRLRELEKEKFTAEMGLLKAQINPHFLFNTLNSLYALILKGSEKASKLVLRLSALMSYMLYEAGGDKVLLKDEISYLENYIGIEQMRFADRLDLSFQYSGDIAGKMIAPLILLPFVENAFKHGIEESSGWITVNLKVAGNRLFLKVENSLPEIEKKGSSGLGLKNVKRRLDLTYSSGYDLQLMKNKDTFEADLKLDL